MYYPLQTFSFSHSSIQSILLRADGAPRELNDLVNKQVNKDEKQMQCKLVVRANKEMNRVQ